MLTLRETADGVIVAVQAHAGGRKNGITGIHDGRIKVSVTQVAEKGKANKAILEVLCRALGLSKSQVTLVSGETSSQKTFALSGRNGAQITALLQAHLDSQR
jgi:uncharacterized protein (TIGR00251 family)